MITPTPAQLLDAVQSQADSGWMDEAQDARELIEEKAAELLKEAGVSIDSEGYEDELDALADSVAWEPGRFVASDHERVVLVDIQGGQVQATSVTPGVRLVIRDWDHCADCGGEFCQMGHVQPCPKAKPFKPHPNEGKACQSCGSVLDLRGHGHEETCTAESDQ